LQALVKTTIFYTNVEDFATINSVFAVRHPTSMNVLGKRSWSASIV
jgi:hypothetical protein